MLIECMNCHAAVDYQEIRTVSRSSLEKPMKVCRSCSSLFEEGSTTTLKASGTTTGRLSCNDPIVSTVPQSESRDCMAAIVLETRIFRQGPCSHRATTEVADGVWLCTKHTKIARTKGRITIIDGRDRFHYLTKDVPVDLDPALVEKAAEKERIKEARFREQIGWAQGERTKRLADAVDALIESATTVMGYPLMHQAVDPKALDAVREARDGLYRKEF